MISSEQETLIGRVFEAYLTEHHHEDLFQLAASVNQATHYPVVVNAMTLFEANMEVADYFNAYPSDVLAIFDKVLHTTVMESAKRAAPKNNGGICTPHVRITGLPVCPEMTRDTIPRCRDVGRFLSVTGTVIRTSVTKVLEYEREYMCTKCRHVFTVQADFSQFCTFAQVVTCPSPHACNSTKFSHLSGGSEPAVCKDYQEIKIQEQVQRLTVGSIPRSIVVILEDDLVDHCKSGDEVTVYGVICQRWKPFYDANRCDVELVLKANNIEVNNKEAAAAVLMKDVQKEFEDFWNIYRHNPIAGRNQILLSLCPQVFGMYLIKLAVAMVLAGGVQRIDSSGTKIRGECHMLLVGDPGTGKSQFLKYATKIMPRSVLTTGIGSTSAGLTVAAVKDGGDWHLEAGALVLSDGGLCCIDEFNSIKEHDRISIHEAMEQQSISVAKAGMVCKLSTRTSILAATNPKGHYDPSDPLSVNVALASPLLSRFDLVLILMDSRNPEWDHVISSFILEDRGVCAESFSLWTLEKMTAYFSVIKRLQPQMSEDANSILTRYYQLQRQSDGCSSSRTTIRMLESLSRLAEAHARLMYRENVTIEDAVMAVAVMECSMQGGALLGNVNALFTSFPVDPIQQYETQCQILLEGLNLRQPLQKEMDRLIRLKRNSSRSPPHTKNNHYQLEETNCIKKTLSHDIASDSKCDSLDWFNCISSTPVSESIASPIITSTQQQPNGNSKSSRSPGEQSNCHIPKGIKSTARKDTDYNKTSNFCRAVPSASKEVMQKDVSKNVEENLSLSQEEMKQSERNSPEQPKCVFLKVSKNLRDQRLNEPRGSGEGGQHGLRVQSRDSPFKTENDESHTSSLLSPGKNSSSNNMRQDLFVTCAGSKATDESKRIGTGIKTVSALAAAEGNACEEWRAKLSNFVFKPRKMCSSDLDAECNLSSRDLYNDTHSKVDTNVLCSEEKEVSQGPSESRIKESDDVEDMQQKNTNTGTEAKLCSFTGIRKKDPGQSTSGFIKSTVPSSALAEFSSICTAESSNTAQSVGEKTAATVKPNLRKRNHSAIESCTSNSEAKKSLLSPAYIREKTPNSGLLGRVLDRQPPACTELTSGQKPEPGTGSSTKWQEKLTDRTRSAGSVQTLHDGPTHSPRPVHMKRRCFELGPPLTNALSLFGSAELCNDVLDTDWDQEVSDKT